MSSTFKRALRFGDHAAIWRASRPHRPPAGASWFVGRFLNASSVISGRWGPRWATRYRLLGHDIGAWILAVLWLGVPLALLLRAAGRLCH